MAKKVNSAFMKKLQPSDALAKVVGASPLPRTEVVKKLFLTYLPYSSRPNLLGHYL